MSPIKEVILYFSGKYGTMRGIYTMKCKNILVLAFLFVAVFPPAAFASSAVRTGDSVSIETDEKIEGDFYTAASVVNLSGEVVEDYLSIAGRNTLNGRVGKDVFMVGATVDVHGPVGDDVRVIGADVVIAEPVAGDVFVIGDTVKVLSTATIGGDLVVYGNTVEVAGAVGGSILGQYETLRVDTTVAGAVDVSVVSLTLGDRADIGGNLEYASNEQLVRAQNAKVGGEISRSDVLVEEADFKSVFRVLLILELVVLFSVLAWFLVSRRMLLSVVTRALRPTIRATTIGFVTFLAAPVILGVLLVSVIGTVIGLIGFLLYALLLILSFLGAMAVTGSFILKLFKKTDSLEVTPYTIVIGVVASFLLLLVPFIGPVAFLAVFLATLGAHVDLLLASHAA
jgi:hypothetical protein